jgi:hypothetical protein
MELYLLDILVFSNNFIVPRGYFTVDSYLSNLNYCYRKAVVLDLHD